MRIYISLLAVLLIVQSCSPDETLPPERGSIGLTMDGSHYIPISGAPSEFKQTRPVDSMAGGWTTPPVPLINGGFAIGSRNGRIFIFNDRDSLERTIGLGANEPVDQLMVDSSTIYAITIKGNIFAYSLPGQERWKITTNGMLTGNAILAADELVVPCDTSIIAFSIRNGVGRWQCTSTLQSSTLAYNDISHTILAGLTHNESGMTDSIVEFNLSGAIRSRIPLENLRITSNIALCGEKKNIVAVGTLGRMIDQRREAEMIAIDLSMDTAGHLLWKHVVPYLVLNVGANASEIVASGFRTLESESVSGIDAFSIADTSVLWSRRFTEPVALPLTISNGNIYFAMTFESQAIVASKGLFYTLRATTGKTVSERAIAGVEHGFIPGMPMPDDRGRLLLADRDRTIVYILDRSVFQRIF